MKLKLVLAALAFAGCSFKVGSANVKLPSDMSVHQGDSHDLAASDNDLSGGGNGGDLSGADMMSIADLMPSPDLMRVCTAGATMCSGQNLLTCRSDGSGYDSTACPLGCGSTPSAHCKTIVPTAPVSVADLNPAGLTSQTLSASTAFNADTGEIGTAGSIRSANTDKAKFEVHNGIGFRTVAIPGVTAFKMGIWTFKDLTIGDGTTAITLTFVGANAAAFASAGDVSVDGQLDLTCAGNVNAGGAGNSAGPGGFAGANAGDAKGGGGNGGGTSGGAGGGGAGYGDVGGDGGGQSGGAVGVAGGLHGAIAGAAQLSPVVGGNGGGAGGGSGGVGGGGGGALQISVNGALKIGTHTASGGVNAGGCGGLAGGSMKAAGGGGSGGGVLLEAVTMSFGASAIIAADGGGGGGGNANASSANSNGADGPFSAAVAASGGKGSGGGNGGPGGANSTLSGTNGGGGVFGANGGGGGGGGAGRIRLNTQSGAATIDMNAQFSPTLADRNASTQLIATQGTVTIQ